MTERALDRTRLAGRVGLYGLAATVVIGLVLYGPRVVMAVAMSLQPYLSAGLGLTIVVYIVHRLLCCSAQYSGPEKFGMSMTAAGMVMATPALWMTDTPFDGWSFNVARFGIALYVITGGLRRDRHDKRNRNQKAYALGFRDGRSAGKVNP